MWTRVGSAKHSPQTWGTGPQQLWFLISRQPPPGLIHKDSNTRLCVPSPHHPELSPHSTQNRVPWLGPRLLALSALILSGARFTLCSNFPGLSIEGSWGIQGAGGWGDVSQSLRSAIEVLASTYILWEVRHPHHQRLCDALPRATDLSVEVL